jgi:hypothetical protein
VERSERIVGYPENGRPGVLVRSQGHINLTGTLPAELELSALKERRWEVLVLDNSIVGSCA